MRSFFYPREKLERLSDAALKKAYDRSLSRGWWRDKALSVAAPMIVAGLYIGCAALGAAIAVHFGASIIMAVAAGLVTSAVAGTGGVAAADYTIQVYEMNRNDEDRKIRDEIRHRLRERIAPQATPVPPPAAPPAKQTFSRSALSKVAGPPAAPPEFLVGAGQSITVRKPLRLELKH